MRKPHRIASLSLALSACVASLAAGCGPAGGVVVIVESDVTAPAQWNGVYEIRNNITISAALTLAPCAEVRAAPDVTISVPDRGPIRAVGTAACPVRFLSAKPVPAAGDWGRIDIYQSASNDSVLQYVEVRHANAGLYGALWLEDRATVGLDNARFVQINGRGIYADGASRFATFNAVSFEATGSELATVNPIALASMSRVTATGIADARVTLGGQEVQAAATWRNLGVALEVPTMTIRGGAVEIEAGSTVQFAPDAVLSVREGGSLRALGTASSPITFRSAKPTPAAGDWRRVHFYGTSANSNLLRNVNVLHGGDTTYGVLWVETGATLALESTTVSMASSCALTADGTVMETGSTLARCGSGS